LGRGLALPAAPDNYWPRASICVGDPDVTYEVDECKPKITWGSSSLSWPQRRIRGCKRQRETATKAEDCHTLALAQQLRTMRRWRRTLTQQAGRCVAGDGRCGGTWARTRRPWRTRRRRIRRLSLVDSRLIIVTCPHTFPHVHLPLASDGVFSLERVVPQVPLGWERKESGAEMPGAEMPWMPGTRAPGTRTPGMIGIA
jgi:hypothetical protein